MAPTADQTFVQKACAYITRGDRELLVFTGPGHDGYQIPKGTVEPGESPREAVFREIAEESGLGAVSGVSHLTSDLWERRESRWYARHFFHADIHEPRDRWTHVVTGEGEEAGEPFEFKWVPIQNDSEFALSLDDYVHLVAPDRSRGTPKITAHAD